MTAEPLPRFDVYEQNLVADFHDAFDAPIADTPRLLGEERAQLRVKLIREELKEYSDAVFGEGKMAFATDEERLIESADALGDLLYVVYGAAIEGGIDLGPIVWAIHESNMTKLGADGKPVVSRGEELDGKPLGKVLKGPNYELPKIREELILQGADL